MKEINSIEEAQKMLTDNQMVLFYFGAEKCGVCRAVMPKIEEVLKGYPRIQSFQIPVEENKDIAAFYSIFTIPGILLFVEGKETIREARYLSVEAISEKINKYYHMYFD